VLPIQAADDDDLAALGGFDNAYTGSENTSKFRFCCKSPLMVPKNRDSVAVMRFAGGER
jgi:hypothetical protein